MLTVDSAVGTVSSSAHLGGLVAVGVGDLDLLQFKALGLGVGGDVGQQVQKGLGGLNGPRYLVSRSLILLANGVTANASSVLGERDGSLELQHLLKVLLGLVHMQTLDGGGDLAAMLVVNAKVTALCLNSCKT